MTGPRMRPAFVVGLLLGFLAISLQGVQSEEQPVPSEDQCRPYIEKALKDLGTGSLEQTSAEVGTEVDQESHEGTTSASEETGERTDDVSKEEGPLEEVEGSKETIEEQIDTSEEITEKDGKEESEEPTIVESAEISAVQDEDTEKTESASDEVTAEGSDQDEEKDEKLQKKAGTEDEKSEEDKVEKDTKSDEDKSETVDSNVQSEEQSESRETTEEVEAESQEGVQDTQQVSAETSAEGKTDTEGKAANESTETSDENVEEKNKSQEAAEITASVEEQVSSVKETPKFTEKPAESTEDEETKSTEEATDSDEIKIKCGENDTKCKESAERENRERMGVESKEEEDTRSAEEIEAKSVRKDEDMKSRSKREISNKEETSESTEEESASVEEQEPTPEEDLIQEIEIPENLRPRDHLNQLLKLDEENEVEERAVQREADIILRDLKRLYDNAIQPLESMYKYRDLSNRHFGDPEIFSKPLVLFMGPWSGGKSSIINYLLDIEYKSMSLRTGGLRECLEEHCKSPNGNDTGAEPSPAYFNIIMHGEEEEVLDGTQLAADWTFSGLQKFGQGLLDRLRGLRLKSKLLEKVNIVEIPGILEIRKQVQRLFPFNDACQWFIDRADIIFLVYDPAKLDVGPETEAILDQLKGREYQTRIILNKADQVKPEELMRVQGALIWNISPLMSSAEPPIMYSASLWSLPYEAGAPIRLLYAQERAFLRDLRSAINKRVEHKIASARRFAVRVRNHAKMVDCYLTTYYNHKTFFGNRKEISDKIIENPQDYHIYEGLSTLTNISRYDLPDPDVYRDFFRLNPLYNFQLLSTTCTYFRGCPINRLDVAIAYDLPELVGKYKKSVEAVLHKSEDNSPPS